MHRFGQRPARRLLLALGAGLGIVLCIAIAPGGAQTARAQGPAAVSIVDFAFQPATVTVPVGGTVTWTNTGNAPHTSTSRTDAWDSGRLTTGQSFSFTFQQAGSFAYFCAVHPQRMMGTVVVQGAAAAQPAPAAQPTPRPAAAAPAPAGQRPAGAVAAPKAQRPAAAPAAARPAPAVARPAAAPQVQRAAAAPAARPAALPRTGTGGFAAADSRNVAPAIAATAVLLLGMLALAYRRRHV